MELVYNYSADVADGNKVGTFTRNEQEVSIQKKHILLKGYVNGKYVILQKREEEGMVEYLCKNEDGVACLLLFDHTHKTLVVIDKDQRGTLFSYDEPFFP